MFRRAIAVILMALGLATAVPSMAQAAGGTVINRCAPETRQALHYGETLKTADPRGFYGDFLRCGSGDSGVVWFNAGRLDYYVTDAATGKVVCIEAGRDYKPRGTVYVTPTKMDCPDGA